MRLSLLPGLALAATLFAGVATAETAAPSRIRATLAQVSDTSMMVKTTTGQAMTIAITPDTKVLSVTKTDLSAVGPNSYIGTAAAPQPDGSLKAREVAVFDESLRGMGDGHYPWDLPGASTMTNGAVGKIGQLSGVTGRTMTVAYAGGQKEIAVPADVPVVKLAPGDKSLLQPGAHVIVIATKSADNAMSAVAVLAGVAGVVPPM